MYPPLTFLTSRVGYAVGFGSVVAVVGSWSIETDWHNCRVSPEAASRGQDWPTPRHPPGSNPPWRGLAYLLRPEAPFLRGMLEGLEEFLCSSGVSRRRPCTWTHLNLCPVPHSFVWWGMLLISLGASGDVIVCKLDKKTSTSDHESHWVLHSYDLAPDLSEKLNK